MTEPRISSVLSGRDRLLIGLFLLVNVAVIVAVLLFNESRSDESHGAAVETPRAGRLVANEAIGARIRRPVGWGRRRAARTIVLRSPDSTTTMSISLPRGAVRSRDVVTTAVAAIRRGYRRVRSRRIRGRVAGLPAVSRVVSAVDAKGVRLTILVSSPQGRRRAWLVRVVSRPGARARRLPEAHAALATLRLAG